MFRFVPTQLHMLGAVFLFVFNLFIYWLSLSSQINAYTGVDPNQHAFASRCQSVSLNHFRKSRFCYHLYYQRITHTHKTHTDRYPYALMGLVAEVVIHLTCEPAPQCSTSPFTHTITTIKAAGWLNIYTFAT